jgi:hypothetical protein
MPNPWDESTNPTEQDEALAIELDRRLELLRSGKLTPTQASQSSDLDRVVDQLHELAVFLSTSVSDASVNAKGGSGETGEYRASAGASLPPPGPADSGRVGKYEIRKVLGQGGQGSALLVFDPDLRRHVVLKLYHAGMGAEGQSMLLGEGRALARVRSPYVAQCFAVEMINGASYLVVEYIPGQSLAEVLIKGRPEQSWALQTVRKLAEGLAAIHACGLLHRDIKPWNIIIGDDGQPRLVDFGLATHLASDQLRRVSGTLAYMAPEQARGEQERIDARTDLFGLGAVLYEMLTGAPPRHGLSRQALMELAQRGDIVPAAQKNPELSPELDALCARCLAKEPGQRFASARDLIRAIDDLTPKIGWFSSLESRIGKVGARAALAAAGLLLVAIPVALWAVLRESGQPTVLPAGSGPALARHDTPVEPQTTPKPVVRVLKKDFAVTLKLVDQAEASNLVGQDRGIRPETPDQPGLMRLVEGDRIAFTVEVARDSYVGIWYVDHEGVPLQLFPNDKDQDHLILAGKPRLVKGLEVTPQLGPEHVHILASTKRWAPLKGERGPDSVFATFASPGQRRAWEDVTRGIALEERALVSELIIPLEVKPKKP